MALRATPSNSIRGRILLVDGNAAGLAARKTVLEEHGHKVWVATGCADAFEQFSSHKFDLVVTDHKMPRTDGLGLISKIKELSPDTPVVLLSGFVDALGLNEHTTGACAVIQKSSTEVQNLVRTVARLLKRKPSARKGPNSVGGSAKSKRAGA
jgi:two-component system response regulator HydG